MVYAFIGIIAVFVVIGIIYSVATKHSGEPKKHTDIETDAKSEQRVNEFRLSKQRSDFAEASASAKSAKSNQGANGTRLIAPSKPKKTNIAPRVSLSSNIEKRTKTDHAHPLEIGAEYRIEKVDMGGSIGGDFTEGCADQYFQRLVKVGKEDIERNEPNYDLIKTVVFGEMLAKPKFKK